ncbi:hypothetical protein [Desulfocurvus sp. DL9XJH121]
MRCPHCSTPVTDPRAALCPSCGRSLDPVVREVRRIPWSTAGWLVLLYTAPLATWAGTGLVPNWAALAGMGLSVALALVLALRLNCKTLAALGLLGGFLAAILLHADPGSALAAQGVFLACLLGLDLAAAALALTRGWTLLAKAAFAATWLVLAASYEPLAPGDGLGVRLWFVQGFLTLFVLWPLAEDLLGADSLASRDAFLGLAAGMLALGLSFPLLERHYGLAWCAGLTLGYSLLYLSAASLLFVLGRRRGSSFGVLAVSSALFLVLTLVTLFLSDT